MYLPCHPNKLILKTSSGKGCGGYTDSYVCERKDLLSISGKRHPGSILRLGNNSVQLVSIE